MLYVGLFIAGFVTWTISTLSGGGGAMTLVPVISFMMGAQAAAPVVTVGTVVGSLGRVTIFRQHIEWRIVTWALPGALAGAALGGYLFSILPVDWLQLALGVFLITTIAQEYFGRSKTQMTVRPWLFAPVYFVVAAMSAVMGAAGPVMNVLFLNAGILKERLVGTKAAISLPMQFAKLLSYFAFGVLSREYLVAGLIVGLGTVLSNRISRWLLAGISDVRYRYITAALMVIAGIAMVWKQRSLLAGLF
ncbi:MAG: sulfite exporter TauE/SafE family protein [Pseudomonadota bacterium]